MKTGSPIHQAENMPNIPYYIVHGDADKAVNKQLHSDVFVKAMRIAHNITYDEVPNMEHCALTGKALEKYNDFIFSFAK